MELAAAI